MFLLNWVPGDGDPPALHPRRTALANSNKVLDAVRGGWGSGMVEVLVVVPGGWGSGMLEPVEVANDAHLAHLAKPGRRASGTIQGV